MKRVLAIAALTLLVWACASAPANEVRRPVHSPEPPPQSQDLHRPGGPFDAQPVHYWQSDTADGGVRTFPMHASDPYELIQPQPTEDVMPGAIPPHN